MENGINKELEMLKDGVLMALTDQRKLKKRCVKLEDQVNSLTKCFNRNTKSIKFALFCFGAAQVLQTCRVHILETRLEKLEHNKKVDDMLRPYDGLFKNKETNEESTGG